MRKNGDDEALTPHRPRFHRDAPGGVFREKIIFVPLSRSCLAHIPTKSENDFERRAWLPQPVRGYRPLFTFPIFRGCWIVRWFLILLSSWKVRPRPAAPSGLRFADRLVQEAATWSHEPESWLRHPHTLWIPGCAIDDRDYHCAEYWPEAIAYASPSRLGHRIDS